MADNTKLEPRLYSPAPSNSISQSPAPTPPVVPLKRKEPPGSSENEQKRFSPAPALPAGVTDTHQGKYEKGCITCEVCGTAVGFQDEETGGFTLEHWEAHRLTCSMPGQYSSDLVIYSNIPEALAHPPAKRRRAKCTEEECINYLRADPCVARFEAYRILCASCDKWIRLRTNSTYCLISWDVHRKSCLAKKFNNENVYEAEARENFSFSKDLDISKLDAESIRVLYSVNPDDHRQAVQKVLRHHRATCQKNSTTLPLNQPAATHRTPDGIGHRPWTRPKPAIFAQSNKTQPRNHTYDNPSFYGSNPSNYAPTQRRNAEQRAATLRADSLISEVEPNRVFCSLCQKWVQLRQDSSYRAYPWLQHRRKCLARQYVSLSTFIPPC
ncbi:hypothetical protein JOM56_008007 [Amanita muscaria]